MRSSILKPHMHETSSVRIIKLSDFGKYLMSKSEETDEYIMWSYLKDLLSPFWPELKENLEIELEGHLLGI